MPREGHREERGDGPGGLDKASGKLASAFAKAEDKGGCAGGDVTEVGGLIDGSADDVRAAVRPARRRPRRHRSGDHDEQHDVHGPADDHEQHDLDDPGNHDEQHDLDDSSDHDEQHPSTVGPTTTSTTTTISTTTTTGGTAVCGNGVREGAEQCDDGNEFNTDACTNACMNARCGDGFTFQGVEQCDDGNAVDNDFCRNNCTFAPAVCGDGIRQNGESCDDGNTIDGDACPPNCIIGTCVASGTRVNTSVLFQNPTAVSVTGLVVYINYPDGRVGIPAWATTTTCEAG
jgi:cysteine-rich repeat protein